MLSVATSDITNEKSEAKTKPAFQTDIPKPRALADKDFKDFLAIMDELAEDDKEEAQLLDELSEIEEEDLEDLKREIKCEPEIVSETQPPRQSSSENKDDEKKVHFPEQIESENRATHSADAKHKHSAKPILKNKNEVSPVDEEAVQQMDKRGVKKIVPVSEETIKKEIIERDPTTSDPENSHPTQPSPNPPRISKFKQQRLHGK